MLKRSSFEWTPGCSSGCDSSFEQRALQQGYCRIGGVDEVGRGALFGPVCAAVVVLDLQRVPFGINDSKKLSAKQRLHLAENIREAAWDFSVAFVEAGTIDRINILEATKEAMRQAIRGLRTLPDCLLCDGIVIDGVTIAQRRIVHGDARSVSIGAASILAKVERDRLLLELDSCFSGYGLAQNKGYGTRFHLEALKRLGPTSQHRLTFRGVYSAGPPALPSQQMQFEGY